MAGIFSISELYFGMMEKDDPMANGMGQIKKSAMQAQKLVRRIIDLHREKPLIGRFRIYGYFLKIKWTCLKSFFQEVLR